jgi:hypothetical protein
MRIRYACRYFSNVVDKNLYTYIAEINGINCKQVSNDNSDKVYTRLLGNGINIFYNSLCNLKYTYEMKINMDIYDITVYVGDYVVTRSIKRNGAIVEIKRVFTK